MIFDKDIIILVVGLCIVSILYVLATFGYKYLQLHGYGFKYIFIISMLFAILLYAIKIPLFYYYDLDNALLTYLLYLIITSITVMLYSSLILHEKIHTHTYVIMSIIVGLFILNDYLTNRK
uniref:Uncharacterized protein n=1 Tax=viral metagenome TaxID=1070528 RepID=A0A6C0IHQ0_9ZZZZ